MRGAVFGLMGLVLILTGCGSGGTTKEAQTTSGPSLVQITIGGASKAQTGKVSQSPVPTNVKSVGLSVTAADMVPVFAATNVTAGAPSVTLTVAVPPGPARTFGVNAYDGLIATGTVLYQGQATADVPPNTAVNVPITLGFLGGSTAVPFKPTGLLASSFSVGQLNLTWPPADASQSVTGYVLYMAETAWTAPWTAVLPGAMVHRGLLCCTFTHSGLSSTTTYYFALATVNAIGEAPESGQVSTIPNGGGGGTTTSTPPIEATVLASSLARPLHIAVDADNVYWSEWNGSSGAGRISKIQKSGGSVNPLVTGLTAPDDIALDTSFVYWGENADPGNVGKVPKTGGSYTLLATGRSFPFSVAQSDSLGSVFFLERVYSSGVLIAGTLRSVSKTGGPVTVTGSDTLASQADDLILYESGGERVLYWPTVSPATNTIRSFDLGAGSLSTLAATNNNSPANNHQIAADKDSVYWAETSPSRIKKVSRCCGGTPTVLAVADNPFAVAIDDLFVYWTELNAAPSGAVKRVATTGGPVTLLASGLNNSKLLAVDKDFVFLTEANTPDGAVRKFLNGRNAWASKASMPTARKDLAAGVIGNTLYAVGGYDGTAKLASLTSYDPLTNTWRDAAPLPTARLGVAAGVINSVLYAVGGDGPPGVLASLTSYNPLTNTWRDAAPLPTARFAVAAGVINSVLYAVGGEVTGALASLTSYDPLTNTWRDAAPLPTARCCLAAGVINNVLYAVGGSNAGVRLASLTSYNPLTNTWRDAAPLPTARCCLAAGVINNVLYAVGGGEVTSALASLTSYDPLTNTWTALTSLPTARYGLAAGVLYNTLYAVGGENASGVLASLEAFVPP